MALRRNLFVELFWKVHPVLYGLSRGLVGGKLMGLPMGCDVCYTNHAEADQNDMDVLLTLLAAAGCNFVMGVPGSDDIMLNYQTTSFHDALYARRLLGLRPAPEFEAWLQQMQIVTGTGNDFTLGANVPGAFQSALRSLA